MISRNLHQTYSFVIQRITWKKKVRDLFRWKTHISYTKIKERFRNWFHKKKSGWSVAGEPSCACFSWGFSVPISFLALHDSCSLERTKEAHLKPPSSKALCLRGWCPTSARLSVLSLTLRHRPKWCDLNTSPLVPKNILFWIWIEKNCLRALSPDLSFLLSRPVSTRNIPETAHNTIGTLPGKKWKLPGLGKHPLCSLPRKWRKNGSKGCRSS